MSYVKTVLTLFSSAARTSSPTAAQFDTSGARGFHLVIDVTAASSPSVVPSIEEYDELSGVWCTLLTGAAITGTGTTVLKLYPGIATAANAAASDIIGSNKCRLSMTHGNSNSATYTASVMLAG